MKILMVVVLLTLICIVHHSAGAGGARLTQGEGCCSVFTQIRVPKGRIRNVVVTPSECKPKGIVVTTVCGKEVCFVHRFNWARTVLDEFQESTANDTTPSAPFNVFKCNEKKI